jgi:hypothetical protein
LPKKKKTKMVMTAGGFVGCWMKRTPRPSLPLPNNLQSVPV